MDSETNAIKPATKHGGFRPGSGRPKKAQGAMTAVKKSIDAALRKDPKALDRIWKKIMDEAEKGSERHATLLLNYYYGKPIETMQVHAKQMVVKRIMVTIDGNANT